jgi:hypothetical protein
MADRIIREETRSTDAPRDTVVVHDDHGDRRSNAPLIIGIILVILILLFLWGGSNIFGGGGGGGSTDINVQTPTPTPTNNAQ